MATAPRELPVGRRATVTVPGSSANLGPGFDTVGLALDITDTVAVEVTASGLEVLIDGEGADDLPRDESHLVVRALRAGLEAAGVAAPGLRVECHNVIPQSRGLGSSAAAAAAGVLAANALSGGALDEAALVQLASAFEGHPDNAAASVLGGAVVSWTAESGRGEPAFRAVSLPVDPAIAATAFVPGFHASTKAVRRVLPETVPRADAVFNVSRSALLAVALQSRPDLLMEATRDRLHQGYRAEVLPLSLAWVRRLREAGHAAYLSGAGPTVLVLGTEPVEDSLVEEARGAGFSVKRLAVAGAPTARVESADGAAQRG